MIQQHTIATKGYHRFRAVAALLCLCLLLAGCIKDDYEPQPEPTPGRTVLFYMGGDNNLSSEVDGKIEKLKTVPVAPGCHLLVYADTKDSNPQLLEITPGTTGNTLTVVRQYEPGNSASSETFGSVLRQVRELYPSPSYGLVLFSHASGWLPEGTYNNPALRSALAFQSAPPVSRSVVIDGKAEMEIPAFAAAIPDGMLDFIVFEACFMAGVEVAYELKDKTEYIIASSAEIVSPGFSPVYGDAIPLLLLPDADLPGFCRNIEESYRNRAGDYGSLTLSIIKTEELDALAATVKWLLFSCEEKKVIGEFGNLCMCSVCTDGGGKAPFQTFDRYGGSLFYDFGQSFGHCTPEGETEALQTAIDGCVVWQTATPAFMPTYGGYVIDAHSGLTTYLPQDAYPKLNEAYKELKWYQVINNE